MKLVDSVRSHDGRACTLATLSRVGLACALSLSSMASYARAQAPTSRDSRAAHADTTHHHRWWPTDVGFAIGPGIGWQRYAEQVSGRETAFSPVGGFFRGAKLGPESKGGFVPAFKVTLFPSKVAAVTGGQPNTTVVETIRLRPMMVGLGWFHPIGRAVSVRFTGLGGWSFNGLSDAEESKGRPELQVASSPTAISNDLTWETSGKLWFAVSPKASFITGVSLIHSRPRLTFANGSVRDWNADHIRLDAGVAFTVFHWHRS